MERDVTKVFGIGMQRTGTTSLAAALRILGYKTLDTPFVLYPDLDRTILDEYDAFTDNPVPLFYKQLDRMVPGSKFIMTTRDIDAWLKSVKWLYSTFEYNWKANVKATQVHNDIYGVSGYNKTIFKATWRRYHEEVQAHFADRPQDLLVIDFTRGEGWNELCAFLRKPVPEDDFPAKNQSGLVKTVRVRIRQLRHYIRSQIKHMMGPRLVGYLKSVRDRRRALKKAS